MSWFSGSGALDTFNGFKDKVQSKVNNIDTDKLLKNLTLQSGMLYVLTCTLRHVLICCVYNMYIIPMAILTSLPCIPHINNNDTTIL